MELHLLYIVAVVGCICIIGSLVKMNKGFGIFNLRVLGITLVATFVTLLAIGKTDSLNSAMGILGAIAGYLFGIQNEKKSGESTSVDAQNSNFGNNAKIAGRDINETIEKLSAEVANVSNNISKVEQKQMGKKDYLINIVFEREEGLATAIENVINWWTDKGWTFETLTSDFAGADGVYLFFSQPQKGHKTTVEYFRSSKVDE
jgi:hypothetical protein